MTYVTGTGADIAEDGAYILIRADAMNDGSNANGTGMNVVVP